MAILKILPRHSPTYRSLLQYIFDPSKVDREEVFTNNLRTHNIQGYVAEFCQNEAFRAFPRKSQTYIFHEILSMQQQVDQPITKEIMADLVTKYIELRGRSSVLVGAVHRDKDNTVHAHFAVSALQYRTGRSIRLSRSALHELKVKFQEYQIEKYPQLTMSVPDHGKSERYRDHASWHASRRREIEQLVKDTYAQSITQQEFLMRLQEHGFHHYERGGKPHGIQRHNQKFRFSRLLDDGLFDALPIDHSDEQRAFEQIRKIRERASRGDRDDIELEL